MRRSALNTFECQVAPPSRRHDVMMKASAVALIALPNAVSALMQFLSGTRKPACPPVRYQPPGWVFGVVWPVLYLLMGVSLAFLYEIGAKRPAMYLLLLLVGLNAWYVVFAPRCMPKAALASILALLLGAKLTAKAAHRARPTAGWLIAPLVAWLTFASFLSYTSWTSN